MDIKTGATVYVPAHVVAAGPNYADVFVGGAEVRVLADDIRPAPEVYATEDLLAAVRNLIADDDIYVETGRAVPRDASYWQALRASLARVGAAQ